jgi:hypothetical protein
MLAFVRESFGKIEAALRKKRLHEIASNKNCRRNSSAVSFDPARDVHGVANHSEFKPFVGANIALYNFAAVDADGNANSLVRSMLFIPTIKTLTNLQGTKRSVCRISLTRKWWAEHGHETVPKELIYRAVVQKYSLAE